MFENGKPDIVLKTVKRFNIKNSYFNFDYKKSLKLGIVVLVMFNKKLVIFGEVLHFFNTYIIITKDSG